VKANHGFDLRPRVFLSFRFVARFLIPGALCLFSLAGSTQAGRRDDEACLCAAAAAAKCFPAWNQVAIPAGSNSFYAVAAFARNDVWAVGSRYDGINDRPFAEHFDGSRWTMVPVPAPGNGAAYLRGVDGSSSTDVWAAGYQITQSGAQQSLIEHYDGVAWSIIPSANPASLAVYLSSVAATAPNNVWAAGYYLGNAGVYRTLAERWDGNSWTIVTTPNAGSGDNALNGLAATGPNDVWAVGYRLSAPGASSATLILHFNGTTWSVVPSPSPGQTSSLSSVVALDDGTVWAAGFYYDGTQARTLLLHGDGSGFAAIAGEDYPNEGNVLNGIAASNSGDIWAAGYHYPSGTSDYQGLIEHYDGQQWTRVSSVQGTSYTYLAGITAQAGGASWAVGNTLTTTIVESVCEIQVADTGFIPSNASGNQGDTIGWSITGSGAHQLVDASGMQLFDSGSREGGASFQFTFNAAASYSIVDLATNASSVVTVPVKLPATATTGTPFTVTWSAATPSQGFVFDVQIRTPSDAVFHNWQVGQINVAATYVPSSPGSYAFRARLRNSTNGAFAKWSPPRTVSVANR